MTMPKTTRATIEERLSAIEAAIMGSAVPAKEDDSRASQEFPVRARGTGVEGPPLSHRVEAALKERPHTTRELAAALGAAAGPVSSVVGKLRRAGQVTKIGPDDDPQWAWRPGEGAGAEERRAFMATLLVRPGPSGRGWSHRELLEAVGARHGQVQGVLVEWLRGNKLPDGQRLIQLGDARRQEYLLVPEIVGEVIARARVGAPRG
jgi:hypothetical protein